MVEGKQPDDFVFTTRAGLPLHNGDFYTHVWRKLMKALAAEGIAPFRFHDLRHTHVAWLEVRGVASDASFDGLCDRDAIRGLGFLPLSSAV